MKIWKRSIVAACVCMTGFALAADDQPRALVSPPSRLAIETPGPTTRSSASIMSEHLRSWIPLVSVAAAPRMPRQMLPVKAPPAPAPLPVIYSAALPAPEKPLFEQAARLAATPAPALLPHIPNLLPTNKRAIRQSGNPIIQPAAPISTPPVCNVDGTTDLPRLPPFAREIQIEIAPQPAPIPFDQAPYLQSDAAPDDLDLPATIDIPAPAPSKMD